MMLNSNKLYDLMADKGFNISDLLVGRGSKFVIPPFFDRQRTIRVRSE